eukprot:XP_011415924.1 PREDICTED: uncharacterized protein LOC105319900 [Crassostrea gigas]
MKNLRKTQVNCDDSSAMRSASGRLKKYEKSQENTRKKSPKKYEALKRRFTEPRVTATREFKVLKALQKRIMQDMEQNICNLWIGASDEYQDGVFRWLNNKTMIPGLWNLGDPTNFASEGGVMLCTNGLWIDGGYSDTNNFVCEKEL